MDLGTQVSRSLLLELEAASDKVGSPGHQLILLLPEPHERLGHCMETGQAEAGVRVGQGWVHRRENPTKARAAALQDFGSSGTWRLQEACRSESVHLSCPSLSTGLQASGQQRPRGQLVLTFGQVSLEPVKSRKDGTAFRSGLSASGSGGGDLLGHHSCSYLHLRRR